MNGLDVSSNHQLAILSCNNNSLTEVYLKDNPELIELFCSENQLTEIDVTGNPKLNRLYAGSNQITGINLMNNPYLSVVSCERNMLDSLDVTGIKWMTTLLCHENRIATPDDVIGWDKHFESVGEGYYMRFLFYPQNTLGECAYHAMELFDQVKPTCRDPGYRLWRCSSCGEESMRETIQSHLWDDGVVTKEPTATDEGVMMYTCLRECCDNVTYSVTIPPFGGMEITGFFKDPNFLAAVREVTSILAGPIYDYDVFGIEYLLVDNRDIHCLSGIEWFERLTVLSCSNNQLTEIDLTMNPFLISIMCAYNELTSLDISGIHQLLELWCYGNRFDSPDVIVGWEGHFTEAGDSQKHPFWFYPQRAKLSITIGDINDDGRIDIGDVDILYQHVSGRRTLNDTQLQAADVNGDGRVDIGDVDRLYQYVSGRRPTL